MYGLRSTCRRPIYSGSKADLLVGHRLQTHVAVMGDAEDGVGQPVYIDVAIFEDLDQLSRTGCG